jgi:hypothetical protein
MLGSSKEAQRQGVDKEIKKKERQINGLYGGRMRIRRQNLCTGG